MTPAVKKIIFGLLSAASLLMSQQKRPAPDGPRLYRVWSDGQGETHLEEINIATKGRATIPSIVMNFSGVVTGPGGQRGGEQLGRIPGCVSSRSPCTARLMWKPAMGPGRTCGPAT